MKVLFINTAFLGDLLISVGVLKSVTHAVEWTLIVRSSVAPFLEVLLPQARILTIKKNEESSYNKILNQIRSETFDIVIQAHSSYRWLFWRPKIKYHQWITFKSGDKIHQFLQIDGKSLLPRIIQELFLLKLAGFQVNVNVPKDLRYIYGINPLTWMLPKVENVWRNPYWLWKANGSKKILIFPFSQWPSKEWPLDCLKQLSLMFQHDGFEVFWVGTAEQKEKALAGGMLPNWNAFGVWSPAELIQQVKEAYLILAPDSAGAHLGALVDAPVVVWYGPTLVSLGYRPWGNRILAVFNGVWCQPCHAHGPKRCLRQHHYCLKGIPSKVIYDKINSARFDELFIQEVRSL